MKLGILTTITGQTLADCCESVYLFEGDWGQQEVHFPVPDPELLVPMGVPIWLNFDENGMVEGDPLYVEDPRAEASLPIGDRRDIRVGIFKVLRRDAYDEADLAAEQRKVDDQAKSVQRFWRKVGGRFLNIEVRGYVMPLAEGDYLPDRGRWCTKSIAEFEEHREFDPQYFHLWGNNSASYCGWGQRPGKYGMTFSSCGWRTMCHELGHNFGFGHSNGFSEGNPDGAEYGDHYCVMGRGVNLNAVHRMSMRLEVAEEFLVLNKSRRLLMAPVDLYKEDMHPGMYQIVKFSRGSRDYVVAGDHLEQVKIHQVLRKPIHLHTLKEGTSTQIEDVSITYEAKANGYMLVTFDFNDGYGGQDVSIPEGLPPQNGLEAPSEAHRGIFSHSWTNGQGFDVQIAQDGSEGIVYWYTYNHSRAKLENEYSQRFFWMPFVTGIQQDWPLYSTSEHGEIEQAGIGRLSFFDADHGVFNYRIEEEGKRARNGSQWLERLTFSQSERQGVFVDEKDSRMALTVSMHGPRIVAFLSRVGAKKKDYILRDLRGGVTNQQWFLCTGEAEPSEMTLPALATEDGRMSEQYEPLFLEAGQAIISWDGSGWTVAFEGTTHKMRRII